MYGVNGDNYFQPDKSDRTEALKKAA